MPIRKILPFLLFAALIVTLVPSSRAQRGWIYLGNSNVDGNNDHDNISVEKPAPFRAVQLRVERAPIRFDHVVVHFQNGGSQTLRIRQVINPGQSTRAIDLKGNRRLINSVEIWYGRAIPNSAKPRVNLYGTL